MIVSGLSTIAKQNDDTAAPTVRCNQLSNPSTSRQPNVTLRFFVSPPSTFLSVSPFELCYGSRVLKPYREIGVLCGQLVVATSELFSCKFVQGETLTACLNGLRKALLALWGKPCPHETPVLIFVYRSNHISQQPSSTCVLGEQPYSPPWFRSALEAHTACAAYC